MESGVEAEVNVQNVDVTVEGPGDAIEIQEQTAQDDKPVVDVNLTDTSIQVGTEEPPAIPGEHNPDDCQSDKVPPKSSPETGSAIDIGSGADVNITVSGEVNLASDSADNAVIHVGQQGLSEQNRDTHVTIASAGGGNDKLNINAWNGATAIGTNKNENLEGTVSIEKLKVDLDMGESVCYSRHPAWADPDNHAYDNTLFHYYTYNSVIGTGEGGRLSGTIRIIDSEIEQIRSLFRFGAVIGTGAVGLNINANTDITETGRIDIMDSVIHGSYGAGALIGTGDGGSLSGAIILSGDQTKVSGTSNREGVNIYEFTNEPSKIQYLGNAAAIGTGGPADFYYCPLFNQDVGKEGHITKTGSINILGGTYDLKSNWGACIGTGHAGLLRGQINILGGNITTGTNEVGKTSVGADIGLGVRSPYSNFINPGLTNGGTIRISGDADITTYSGLIGQVNPAPGIDWGVGLTDVTYVLDENISIGKTQDGSKLGWEDFKDNFQLLSDNGMNPTAVFQKSSGGYTIGATAWKDNLLTLTFADQSGKDSYQVTIAAPMEQTSFQRGADGTYTAGYRASYTLGGVTYTSPDFTLTGPAAGAEILTHHHSWDKWITLIEPQVGVSGVQIRESICDPGDDHAAVHELRLIDPLDPPAAPREEGTPTASIRKTLSNLVSGLPKTGDGFRLWLYVAVALTSGTALAVIAFLGRKRRSAC